MSNSLRRIRVVPRIRRAPEASAGSSITHKMIGRVMPEWKYHPSPQRAPDQQRTRRLLKCMRRDRDREKVLSPEAPAGRFRVGLQRAGADRDLHVGRALTSVKWTSVRVASKIWRTARLEPTGRSSRIRRQLGRRLERASGRTWRSATVVCPIESGTRAYNLPSAPLSVAPLTQRHSKCLAGLPWPCTRPILAAE